MRRIPKIEVDGQPEMIVDDPIVYRLDVFVDIWEDIIKTLKKV